MPLAADPPFVINNAMASTTGEVIWRRGWLTTYQLTLATAAHCAHRRGRFSGLGLADLTSPVHLHLTRWSRPSHQTGRMRLRPRTIERPKYARTARSDTTDVLDLLSLLPTCLLTYLLTYLLIILTQTITSGQWRSQEFSTGDA